MIDRWEQIILGLMVLGLFIVLYQGRIDSATFEKLFLVLAGYIAGRILNGVEKKE